MPPKYNTYIVILGGTLYGFLESDLWKRQKKKKKSVHNKHIYIYGSQSFWSFMKFYFVHIVKVCFVFKKQSYIAPYMHKTLPALVNEKEH